MIRTLLSALTVAAVCSGAAWADDHSEADDDALKAWVDARAGTGPAVHWVSEGGIFAYPSGEKLFGMYPGIRSTCSRNGNRCS